jgi:hypothetical protein
MLKCLLSGNSTINEFYVLNKIPIPNWVCGFLLLFFRFFLPGWLTEKAFLILYIVGMAASFRYLVKVISPQNRSLSFFIFPFMYSSLFHLGFYNFNFSFIFFFLTLGFWFKMQKEESFKKYIILFVLITLMYFSNILMLFFLGLTIGLYSLYSIYEDYQENDDLKTAIYSGSIKMLKLFLITLPSLLFLIVFYRYVTFVPISTSIPFYDLLKWINDCRGLITYTYSDEQLITSQFVHLLVILLIVSFIFKEKSQYSPFKKVDIIVIPLLLSLALLFIIPNGSNAGMMSDRYCIIFFIYFLIWAITRAFPSKYNFIFIFFVLLLHFGLLIKQYTVAIKSLNIDAINFCNTSNYIEPNSIVLPIDLSDSWLENHFSNYLGIDKPMIILENYEARIGWFPLKWNLDKMPDLYLGDKNKIANVSWPKSTQLQYKRQINYVLISGKLDKLKDSEWVELNNVLSTNYKIKYYSQQDNILLYENIQDLLSRKSKK